MNNNYSINRTLDPRAVNKSSSSLPLLPIDSNLIKLDRQIFMEEPNLKNPHNSPIYSTDSDGFEITHLNYNQHFKLLERDRYNKIPALELGKTALPITDFSKERVLSNYHKSPNTKKYEPNLKPKPILKKTTKDFKSDDSEIATEVKLSQYAKQITEPLIEKKSSPAYFCGCLKKENTCHIQ